MATHVLLPLLAAHAERHSKRHARHALAVIDDLIDEFHGGWADLQFASLERRKRGAIGVHAVTDAIDNGLTLIGILREAGDGEIVLRDVDEAHAAQHHTAWKVDAGIQRDDLALIKLRLAHLDLKEWRGEFIAGWCCRIGGSFGDDEFDLVGLHALAFDEKILRRDGVLTRLGASDLPGEVQRDGGAATLHVDALRLLESGAHADLRREAELRHRLELAVLHRDDVVHDLVRLCRAGLHIGTHGGGSSGEREAQQESDEEAERHSGEKMKDKKIKDEVP